MLSLNKREEMMAIRGGGGNLHEEKVVTYVLKNTGKLVLDAWKTQ